MTPVENQITHCVHATIIQTTLADMLDYTTALKIHATITPLPTRWFQRRWSMSLENIFSFLQRSCVKSLEFNCDELPCADVSICKSASAQDPSEFAVALAKFASFDDARKECADFLQRSLSTHTGRSPLKTFPKLTFDQSILMDVVFRMYH